MGRCRDPARSFKTITCRRRVGSFPFVLADFGDIDLYPAASFRACHGVELLSDVEQRCQLRRKCRTCLMESGLDGAGRYAELDGGLRMCEVLAKKNRVQLPAGPREGARRPDELARITRPLRLVPRDQVDHRTGRPGRGRIKEILRNHWRPMLSAMPAYQAANFSG